ncbi:SatD family protein [Microbacterium lacticum]
MSISVIADIVGSRELPDRGAAQRAIEAACADVDRRLPPQARAIHPLRAVVGDEFQGVFPSVRSALAATLLLRLALPAGVELRFGIGVGASGEIPSQTGALAEGPAWWAARAAVEHVEQLAQREVAQARTWVVADEAEGSAVDELVRIANAGALTRDRIIGRWSDRVRHLVSGRIAGATQAELAEAEQISQSAVSQTLSAAGATTIILAYEELTRA